VRGCYLWHGIVLLVVRLVLQTHRARKNVGYRMPTMSNTKAVVSTTTRQR
jgi:hypothetical protein